LISGRDEALVPILLDYFTRDGSTLMMRLLATSPQIVVGEPYPFERKYFAYLFRWARLLDRPEWPNHAWNRRSLGSIAQEDRGLLGPPPWVPRPLFEPAAGEASMSQYCFDVAWAEFSRRARAHHADRSELRYYAEKHMDTRRIDLSELPPVKLIVLLRDPRDTFVSIKAFDRKRREERQRERTMWPSDAKSQEQRLGWFMDRQRERMRWIRGLLESGEAPVVRYEDLVLDLAGVSERLESWLGIELDAGVVANDRRMRTKHVSANSPEASIGRWRKELPRTLIRRFNDELGEELTDLGFDVPPLPREEGAPARAPAGAKR